MKFNTSSEEQFSLSDTSHLEQDIPITNSISNTSLAVFFIFASLGLGSFLKEINKSTKIPYSPMLFVVGLLAGLYWDSLGIIGQSCKVVSEIEPVNIFFIQSGVLIIFLPTLIYESGYNFDWHLFKKLFTQILILAFPCVIILSVLLQLSVKVLLNYGDDYYTWESAFMFGVMLSCTDTVAVLALLKESGASKRFQSLIEGESLLNDGACMVLFQISYAIVKGGSASAFDIASLFTTLCFGGTLLGIIFGLICVYWIKKIFNDEILVLNITIVSCYLVFYVAEHVHLGVHISGVLGLVSLSLFMAAFGRSRISHEADHALREFWEYVVYASETIIFLLGGIIAGISVFKENQTITQVDFYKMLALWGCLMVCRFISIFVFFPLLKKYGYGLKFTEVLVLTYGGLRGSIGIAFALIVAKDGYLPKKEQDIILFHMSGVAVCTLVVNGTTLSLLIKYLGLSTQTAVREKIYSNFLSRLIQYIDQICLKNQQLKYLKEASWDYVKELSGAKIYHKDVQAIADKLEKVEKLKDIQMRTLSMPLVQQMNEDDEQNIDLDLQIEIRRIFLMGLKGIYMEKFEKNQCQPDTLIVLVESANLDLDNDKEPMNSWDFLLSQFSERYINFLFYFKNNIILGGFARNLLFTYIFNIYDVVSTFISSVEELLEEAEHYTQFPEHLKEDMINEARDNQQLAEQYLQGYLQVSFPEISNQLYTKKAAIEILEFEKQLLKTNLNSGQLSEKEFMRMKRNIDGRFKKLNNMNPKWELPSLLEIVKKIPLFKNLPDNIIRKMIVECREASYGKDQIVFKEGDRVQEIMIITRGAGFEFSDKHKIKQKRIIEEVAPIYMLVAPSIRHQTSFTTSCVINATFIKIQTLQQIIKENQDFEEAVWKQSLHILSKIYADHMKPLCHLNQQQIEGVISNCTYQKIRKNTVIRIEQGCILLKGALVEARGKIQETESEDEDNLKEHEAQGTKQEGICILPPTEQPMKSVSTVIILAFKQFSSIEQIPEIQQQGAKQSSVSKGRQR